MMTRHLHLRKNKWNLVGHISIGSPAQNFTVLFDFCDGSDLSLISSRANTSSVDRKLPKKSLFDSSRSATFLPSTRNFSTLLGNGIEAKDFANILGVSTYFTFGIIKEIGWTAEHFAVDGVLGLSLQPTNNNVSTSWEQLSGHMDKLIISIFNNRTKQGNGSAIVTMQDFDSVNCQSDWVKVSLVGGKQQFFLHSLQADLNNEEQKLIVNRNVSILPFFGRIYAPNAVKFLITNASGAVYNETVDMYIIDCDMQKAGNVTLNVRSGAQTQQLVLTGRDYIKHCPIYDVCYVAIIGYEDEGTHYTTVSLPQQFLNNRCMAFDISRREIAFANVRYPNNEPKRN
uniref:Peptidase A1 domain-containing protein n=1 Tax=Ditylenchus dipsaci TaxID=166011 RepID=A0A915DNF6_9BILA